MKAPHVRGDWVGLAVGALANIGVQAAWYRDALELYGRHGWGDFLRQFSWLMFVLTAGFGWLIGYLYRVNGPNPAEAEEIEREVRERKAARGR